MTTVSPLSSSLLQALSANGNGSSSGTGSSLLSALENAQGSGEATASQLLQTLVTLGSSSSDSSVQTYNAQGLINQVQAAMAENPLFATGSGNNATDSPLGSILGNSRSSGSGDAASSNLLQLFQQSPTLAAAYVNGEVTQSLFSDMA